MHKTRDIIIQVMISRRMNQIFFKEVSEDGIKRFMSILDELFKAVEKLGGSVNDDLSIKIRSDIVRIRVAEAKDKISWTYQAGAAGIIKI